MVKVRAAEMFDIPQILTLLNEVSDLHGDMRNDIFIDKPRHITEEKLKKFILDENHYVLVIGCEANICGVMLCKIRKYMNDIKFKDCKIMSIEDTCIKKEYRSNNYATQLLQQAIEIANTLGCHRIETNVWEFNEPSYKWLNRNGFRTQRKVLEYIL